MTETLDSLPVRPAVTQFRTADPMRGREFLTRVYGAKPLVTGAGDQDIAVTVTHTDVGSFAVSDIGLAADLAFEVGTSARVIIGTVAEGTIQVTRGKVIERYRSGDMIVSSSPNIAYICHTHRLTGHYFVLPLNLCYAVTGTDAASPEPLRFLSMEPVSAAARARWRNIARYADGLLADEEAAASPLLISSVARMLAATALTAFPNNLIAGSPSSSAQDEQGGSTATLRRAVAYIEEHACQNISVSDIAAAACVTVRATQLAFRRYLNTTPMAYLRQVRLGHAHRELKTADPALHTVTAIAYRWGFSSASGFTTWYRDTYGVLPSNTLRG
jgi:AraC-like DNA-binding protein